MVTHVTQEIDRISKCAEYFVDVQVWNADQPDFDGWLSNFSDKELPLAALLLDAFLFFSSRMCNQMFFAAFQTLSSSCCRSTLATTRRAWSRFLESVSVCLVSGEEPNPSDSGYVFSRKARQYLGFSEDQLFGVESLIQNILQFGPRPVVFVDDFVGSGNQFITQWRRPFRDLLGARVTIEELANNLPGLDIYYCPLIMTEFGFQALTQNCPQARLRPAHILDLRSDLLNFNSDRWSAATRSEIRDFVYQKSMALGIPDSDGSKVDDWQGYRKLGLAIAFQHGVPDATMPIFRWEKNWKPLVKRR